MFYVEMLNRLRNYLSNDALGFPSNNLHIHAVSYAGHGPTPRLITGGYQDFKPDTHSLAGQIEHKLAFVDSILDSVHEDSFPPQFIFLGHSIGCHLVQKMILARPNIEVLHTINLMPFVRFDPSLATQKYPLKCLASQPEIAINVLKSASFLARNFVPKAVAHSVLKHACDMKHASHRDIALDLTLAPGYSRNFLALGTEEIRALPSDFDLKLIDNMLLRSAASSFLYCGGPDCWAPLSHFNELKALLSDDGVLDGGRVSGLEYFDSLRHDFCVKDEMSDVVVDFCGRSLCKALKEGSNPMGLRSRL